jgi:phage baseplate assembly protein W
VSRSIYRALRFVHPSFEPVSADGPGAGGLRVAVTGGLDTVDAPLSIRQALRLLLSTEPGERVMRPAYGCALSQLMFAPNDATTAGLALHFVRRAIETWEPRVEILQLQAAANPADAGRLDIHLEYRIRRSQITDSLTLPLSLMGEPLS